MMNYFFKNLTGLIGPLMVPRKFPAMIGQSFGLLKRRQWALRAVRPEGADTTTFVFSSEKHLRWRAGQHFLYTLPHASADAKGTTRFFTVASAPHEKDVWITTRLSEPGSTFKQALRNLRVGQTISARGPLGIFVIDDPARHHIFLAGGIGITPFRAILSDLDHRGEPLNVSLLYTNSTDDFTFRQELDRWASKHDSFTVDYIVSPQRITAEDIQKSAAVGVGRPLYYISGSHGMVQHYYRWLRNLGIARRDIRRDVLIGY